MLPIVNLFHKGTIFGKNLTGGTYYLQMKYGKDVHESTMFTHILIN